MEKLVKSKNKISSDLDFNNMVSKKGIDLANAVFLISRGNSMAPLIPDGSTVGIDTTKIDIQDGATYAYACDGNLYLKILHHHPAGGLVIKSFNATEYPDITLIKEEATAIKVIGRVFWYSVLI